LYKILAKTFFVGKKVIFLPTCHSTNEIAESILKEKGIYEGTIVVTGHQTAGQGQRGNTWESEPGANLTFSLILQPNFLHARKQFFLNIITSMAVADFLISLGCKGVKVKWPNDVYCGTKKVCGILIKNTILKENLGTSVIGIGLNVNQGSFKISTATSIKTILGVTSSLPEVLEGLSMCLEKRYLQLKNGGGVKLEEDYVSQMYWAFENHVFHAESEFHGSIQGIDTYGRLQIKTEKGVNAYNFKEVAFIR